jgi:hypothetical protein
MSTCDNTHLQQEAATASHKELDESITRDKAEVADEATARPTGRVDDVARTLSTLSLVPAPANAFSAKRL